MNSAGLLLKVSSLAIATIAFGALSGCMKAPDPANMSGSQSSSAPAPATAARPPHLHVQAPGDWTGTEPTQTFYLKTWSLPDGGIANISYLSPSLDIIESNLDRWIGQWSADSQTQRYKLEGAAMETTVLVVEGTLEQTGQLGGGGGGSKENWILIGAVSITEMGPVYTKAMGPMSSLKAQKAQVETMLKTMTAD